MTNAISLTAEKVASAPIPPPADDKVPVPDDTARGQTEALAFIDGLAFTLLRTKGPLATKRVVRGADGKPRIEGYAKAKRFGASIVRFADVRALFALLQRLDRDPRRFLIRASLLPGLDPREVRRLVKRCGKTGEGPFFADVPRAWAAFDFDSVPAPVGLDPLAIAECGDWLRGLLPDAFQDAACIVQATSGCGLKPGLRYRLWFVLSRPLLGREVEAWCAGVPLDASTLRAVEPIYTARPVFEGVRDPVPVRFHLLEGLEDAVPVPEVMPERARPGRRRGEGGGTSEALPALGFEDWLGLIGDGEGLEGFRLPVLRAFAAYAGAHGAEGLEAAAEALKGRVRAAIGAAPKRPDRGDDLDRYRSDAHLDELLDWFAEAERRRAAEALAALPGRVLDEHDLDALRQAFRRSRAAREIWAGQRAYPEARVRRFAFAAALARAGVKDDDVLHKAVIELEDRHGQACPEALAAAVVASALRAEGRA